jgi:DNA-binding NarL/FixJ family response regulator
MIAQKLDVSETAIKACLHATYEKLGVRSRYELIFVLANRGKPKPD